MANSRMLDAQTIDIGARIGMNLSSFNQNLSNPPLTSMPGVTAGVQGDYWFSQPWALSVQVLYVQKKASLSSTVVIVGGPINYISISSHNYIEIPLEAKLRPLNDGRFRPYLFAGATIGFLYSATSVTNYSSGASQTYDLKNSTRPNDIGIIGGLGLDYVVMPEATIFLESSYRLGLISLYNTSRGYTVNDLRFWAGIVFGI